MKRTVSLSILIASVVSGSACADIVQPNTNSSYGTNFYRPLGQSFTATTNESKVGAVSFLTGTIINSHFADPTITANLRNGIGYTGSVLGSQTLSIPDSTPPSTWIDFVFDSPITLTPGQTYTLEFATTNVEITALSFSADHDNPYSGGTLILNDGRLIAHEDVAFRVLSVPEPSVVLLAVSIFALLASRRSRRHS